MAGTITKKIKFPDGVTRRIKVRDDMSSAEVREVALNHYYQNIQDADLPIPDEFTPRREEKPEPGVWERVGALINAGVTTGGQAAMGALTAPVANAQALANSVTRGDFGTYEGARRTQQEAGGRIDRVMPDTSTTARVAGVFGLPGGNPELASQYLETVEPVLATLEAGAPGLGVGGRLPRGRADVQPAVDAVKSVPARVVDNAKAAVGAVRPSYIEDQQRQRSVSAAETSAKRLRLEQMERRAYEAEQAGLSADNGLGLTRGQLARDYENQSAEDVLQNSENGEPLRDRRDAQNEALRGRISDVEYEVGRSDDGDYTPLRPYEVGDQLKTSLDTARENSKLDYKAAYILADNSPDADKPVSSGILNEVWNGDEVRELVYSDAAGDIKTLESFFVDMGLGEIVDGNLRFDNLTLGKLEKIRRKLNSSASQNNNSIPMVTKVKDAIERTLEQSDDGTLYKDARGKRRQFGIDYEEHDFINRLLGQKSKTSKDLIPSEEVASTIQSLSRAELLRLKDQVIGLGPEGVDAWRNIRSGIARYIARESVSNDGAGKDQLPVLKPARFGKIIEDLDENGKLEDIFGAEQAEVLRNIAKTARTVNQNIPGARNFSGTQGAQGTAARILDWAKTGGISMVRRLPAVGSYIEGIGNDMANKRQQELVVRQLDGQGMLESLRNE